MKPRIAIAVVLLVSAGCALPPPMKTGLDPGIVAEINKTSERKAESRPEAVEKALLPPLRMEMPSARGQPIDPRFDLTVNNAPAGQVFMSIVSGTRYSMMVHPSLGGTISVNLKDVTLREALDSIRELYGYDYKIDGMRILIQPAGMQTRLFQVNYLTGDRRGISDLRVQSGSVSDGGAGAPTATAGPPGETPAATRTRTPTNTPTPTITPTPIPTCSLVTGTGDAFQAVLDNPIDILDDEPEGATSCMELNDAHTISDLDVGLTIEHTWVGDLVITLIHDDTATEVRLIDRPDIPASGLGCSSDGISVTLSDEAASDAEDACSTTGNAISGTLRPNEALAAFDGEGLAGTWRLRVVDAGGGDDGSLLGWSIIPNRSSRGDANCSGRVDSVDVALMLQLNAGLVSSLSCQGLADVNRDGRTDSIDAALVLQFIAGLLNSLG